ncbi:MAG: CYTH domain-containing protein [Treponema sp.]|jgi:adenylate cyclase class 2|nr:CYTH domain-containing protein [Treponema sp.]
MALEVELKARVDDPQALKARLSAMGLYLGAYEKDDAYWLPAQGALFAGENSPALPPPGLRVRRERNTRDGGGVSEHVLVTWKTGRLEGGVEINDEREFTVSDAALFEDLLERLGLEPVIRKNKQGWAWNCPGEEGPVRAELSNVRGLGWFLELEITEKTGGADGTRETGPHGEEAMRQQLFSLLEKLEIPRDRIESRPYTRMLAAGHGAGANRAFQ